MAIRMSSDIPLVAIKTFIHVGTFSVGLHTNLTTEVYDKIIAEQFTIYSLFFTASLCNSKVVQHMEVFQSGGAGTSNKCSG